MFVKYVLLVNKQGQTRASQYYEYLDIDERATLEPDIVRRCLSRSAGLCSFFDYKEHKVVFRRYASLYFIVGVEPDTNELSVLEFIHSFVETLDMYFGNVCELDIMFNLEKVHMILEEMISNGFIVETNKRNILFPLQLMDEVE